MEQKNISGLCCGGSNSSSVARPEEYVEMKADEKEKDAVKWTFLGTSVMVTFHRWNMPSIVFCSESESDNIRNPVQQDIQYNIFSV